MSKPILRDYPVRARLMKREHRSRAGICYSIWESNRPRISDGVMDRAKAVEAVARMICRSRGDQPERRIPEYRRTSHSYPAWEDFRKEAEAALDAVLAEIRRQGGKVLVREPTRKMKAACGVNGLWWEPMWDAAPEEPWSENQSYR